MSAVGSAIAELEAQRAELDQAIAVLRRIEGRGPVMVPAPIRTTGTVTSKPKAGKRKPGTRATPETWAEARKLFEAGTDPETIAKQLGVTKAAIYWQSSNHGWKRPKASKPPAGEALPGSVRCPQCQVWTDRDPCSSCGKKVRR